MGDLENAISQREADELKVFMQGASQQGEKWLEGTPPQAAVKPETQTDAAPVGAITYGYQQGKATLGTGAHNVVTGVNNMITGAGETTQRGRVKGAAQVLEGLFQMGLSPVVGAAGAIGDTLEKMAPGLAQTNVLGEGQIPGVIRTMLNPFGAISTMLESPESIAKMTDEQLAEYRNRIGDYSKPLTFREALETGVSMAIPIAIANKLAPKAKEGVPQAKPTEVLTPEDAQAFVDKVKTEAVEAPPQAGPAPVKPLAINWDELGSREAINRNLVKANALRDDNVVNFSIDRLSRETDLGTLQGWKAALDKRYDEAVSKSKGFNDPDVNAALALSKFAQDRVKQLTSGEEPVPVDVPKVVERMNAEQPPEMTQAMVQRLTDDNGAPAARSFTDKFWEASKRGVNAGWEYWMGAMLSSPKTWAKKAISDTGMILQALPERVLMRVNHELFFRDDINGTQAGEASAMVHGFIEGTKTVIGAIARRESLAELPGADVYTGPQGQILSRDWNTKNISAENLGVDRLPIISGATDVAGSIVRTGPNVLKNVTRMASAVNFQMEAAAQIVRQAHIEAADLRGKPGYAEKVVENMQRIKDDMGDYQAIESRAVDAANYRTFMRELGPRAEAFMDFIAGTPLRVNQPFYRVPINFGKEAVYMFPPGWIASRIWGEMGREWNAGGARREAALAKLEMGALITGAFGIWAISGKSTGGGPTEPALRENWLASGRRPYMIYPNGIKPGAEGVSLHTIAPWGLVGGAVQDIAEIWGQIPTGLDLSDKALNIGAALTLGVTKSLESESMFQSWANFLNAVHQPLLEANVYLRGLASSVVPAGWKTFQSVYLDQTVKEVRDPLDRLRADVWRPGAVDRKDHITGKPILYPPGLGPDIVSPFTMSEITFDAVAQELYDQQIRVQRLPWVVSGNKSPAEFLQVGPTMPSEGIPINGLQRDRWVDIMTNYKGDGITVGGKNLHDALEGVIRTPQYQALPQGPESPARALKLQPIISAYREKARLQLLREDPVLRVDSMIHDQMRLRNQLPITNPKATGRFNPIITP